VAGGGNLTPGSVPPYASQYGVEDLRTVVQAIRDALEAGVDSLEHVSLLTREGVGFDPDLLDAVARSGSYVSLTVGWDRRVEAELPQAMAEHMDKILSVLRDLFKHGAKIVIGSEAGTAPDKPHDVLPRGVGDLVRLGVPPLDALISVTSSAARLCRMEGRKGRIAAGADADLLAVEGDPSEDPAALQDVRAVFRAGVRDR
jgi:imidazolonepropionase-like amidohydrolase